MSKVLAALLNMHVRLLTGIWCIFSYEPLGQKSH